MRKLIIGSGLGLAAVASPAQAIPNSPLADLGPLTQASAVMLDEAACGPEQTSGYKLKVDGSAIKHKGELDNSVKMKADGSVLKHKDSSAIKYKESTVAPNAIKFD